MIELRPIFNGDVQMVKAEKYRVEGDNWISGKG